MTKKYSFHPSLTFRIAPVCLPSVGGLLIENKFKSEVIRSNGFNTSASCLHDTVNLWPQGVVGVHVVQAVLLQKLKWATDPLHSQIAVEHTCFLYNSS